MFGRGAGASGSQHLPSLSAGVADSYIKVSDSVCRLGTVESQHLDRLLHSVAELLERVRVSPSPNYP